MVAPLAAIALKKFATKSATQFAMKKGGGSAFSQILSGGGKQGAPSLSGLPLGQMSDLSKSFGLKTSSAALGLVKGFQATKLGGFNLRKGLNLAGSVATKVVRKGVDLLNGFAEIAETGVNSVFGATAAGKPQGGRFSGPDM